MRIGLVCPYSFSHPGGVQNHVLGLASWLADWGHEPFVLGPGHLTSVPRGVHFTGAGSTVPVAYNGSVARVNFGAGPSLRVRRWLREVQPDLVHLHEPISPSVSLLALWQSTAPVVATFHSAATRSRSLRAAERMLPRSLARIDAAICVSDVARAVTLDHLGLDGVVIGNGIRTADYDGSPTRGRWRGGARPRITFVGRYDEPRKGFAVLLDALPLVRSRRPDVQVDVVGQGSGLAHEPGLRLRGPLPDAGRNALLASSDVYVAPQTGRESFGIVLLEALASGAPVVASDLPSFRAVLSDDAGPVGRLVPPGDAPALAEAIGQSLDEPRDLRLLRGRRLAARFDWNVLGPQVLAQYHRVLAPVPV